MGLLLGFTSFHQNSFGEENLSSLRPKQDLKKPIHLRSG
ncbi:uncharacterized protein G2W53_024454 [Senna tora]|uniref:Uncharacterized protein n=1 Tax=Senna tora TaxID=362788 RepID=A0A834TK53_9FABA|nr:uncharacterized protein G2W53_024454 [Senna tora]